MFEKKQSFVYSNLIGLCQRISYNCVNELVAIDLVDRNTYDQDNVDVKVFRKSRAHTDDEIKNESIYSISFVSTKSRWTK